MADKNSSEGFDAPDEAGKPRFLRGERWMPDGEDLGTLIDALETFFGFGDGFNRSYPKFFSAGRVKSDADALPAVLHAEHRAGECAAEAEILRTLGRFKKTVGLGRSEEVDDRFDANGDRLRERLLELQANLTGDFASVGAGPNVKRFASESTGGATPFFAASLSSSSRMS